MSTIIDIPLNVEFRQLFLFNSLKLKGHPFFKTSLALYPSSSIIDFEWEISVIAKAFSSNFLSISENTLFCVEITSQFFGPFQRIRVFSLLSTDSGFELRFRLSILISSYTTLEFLCWTIWVINKFFIYEILIKLFSFFPS